ncbi:D-isomer specific 2-hydroxyacid dehydrogenase [Trichoderma velutinum]
MALPRTESEAIVGSGKIQNSNRKPNIYLLEVFPEAAVQYCQSLFNTIKYDDPEVENWRQNADAIMVREKVISAADIAAAGKLRAIAKQGTGIDIIDKDACDAKDIPICNTPGVNAQSVAELVLALSLGVARQLRTISVKQEAGIEVRKEHCLGLLMQGKSIGIVGMGAIGSAVARMFHSAFNFSIYACDPFAPADHWSDIPHTRLEHFEEMLPHVDILTLHVPLNSQTRGMVGRKHFNMMKPSSILINVARGGIVDEDALLQALKGGGIFGAGLDCHEEEPPTLQKYQALWETGKVISTPHIGATTKETVVRTATAAMDNVFAALTAPAAQN